MSDIICPKCQRPARLVAEHNRYACDSCQSWLDVMGPTTATAAAAPAAAPVAAVEAPRRQAAAVAGERPWWVPLAGLGALFGSLAVIFLLVGLLTGELLGNGLPDGTARGLGGDSVGEISARPVEMPARSAAVDPDAPLSEAECTRLFEHVFDIYTGPDASPDVKKMMEEQRAEIIREGVPKCQREFSRSMYTCAMAARTQDALASCDEKKRDVEKKYEEPARAEPKAAEPRAEPMDDYEGGEE